MDIKKTAIHGIRWSSLSTLITNILVILQYAYLARLLAPSEFGLVAIVTVVVSFLQIFSDLGITNAIIHRQVTDKTILSSLFYTNIFIGFILFLLLSIMSLFIAGFYAMPELSRLIPLASFSFILYPAGQIHRVLLQKDFYFDRLAITEIISAFFSFFLSVILAYQNFGAYALIWGSLASAGISSLLYIFQGKFLFVPSWFFRTHHLRPFLFFGFFQMGDRITNFISWNIDKLIIGKYLGSEALGFYNMAFQLIIKPITLINPIVNKIALPVFARIQNDIHALNQAYAKQVQAITLIAIPIYTYGFSSAHLFIPVLYGPGWDATVTIFQYFCFVGIIWSIGNPLGSLLMATGKVHLGMIMNVIGLVAYTIAVYLGSQKSIETIALYILFINFFIMLPLDYIMRFIATRMPVRLHWHAYWLNLVSGLIAMMVVLIFLLWIQGLSDKISLFLSLLVYIASYAVSIYLLNRPFLMELNNHLFTKR